MADSQHNRFNQPSATAAIYGIVEHVEAAKRFIELLKPLSMDERGKITAMIDWAAQNQKRP